MIQRNDHRHPIGRKFRRRTVAAMLSVTFGLAPFGVVALISNPAQAATKVPVTEVSPRALALLAGSTANLAVRFSSARPSSLRWAVEGSPVGVSAGFTCTSSRVCQLTLRADPAAPEDTVLLEFVLRAGTSSRRIPLALHVEPGQIAAPPAPPVPPVTAPPVTTVARTLALRPDTLISTVNPGARAVFNINLLRNGWSDPVAMILDGLPSGWRAAYIPNPVSSGSTLLILDTPANAGAGDYPIRISGRSGSTVGESLLVVRLRAPQLSLTLLSSGPAVAAGGTTRFILDARSIDDPSRPVTLRTEGLPSGVTATFSPNPATGTVTGDIGVNTYLNPVAYAFYFVASSGGVEIRLPAVLTVVAPVTAFFRFTPTAVTPVPGDARGYGLSSFSNTLAATRGTTTSFDVLVSPKGGFIDPIDLSMTTPSSWSTVWTTISPNLLRVTIAVPASASTGAAPLVLSSSSGNLSASLTFTVNVS